MIEIELGMVFMNDNNNGMIQFVNVINKITGNVLENYAIAYVMDEEKFSLLTGINGSSSEYEKRLMEYLKENNIYENLKKEFINGAI